jgi:ADP-heptose:LPS heptosyltransferase
METNNTRILFITLSNIGDAIMTTPVLQALHTIYPEAIIDIVADQRSGEIFNHCPYRGEILYKQKNKVFRGGWQLLKTLHARKYDLIVDLRTDGFAYLLRANKRLTKWHSKSKSVHAVEQYMGIISPIYTSDQIPACHIWIGKSEVHFANQVFGPYKGKKMLGVGPGANSQKKIWPADSYVALIDRLRNHFDAVILLGNGDDQESSGYISRHADLFCIDLCGKAALLQTAAVLGHIALYVGNDSGLGHMASAMDKPTMTIFGPGNPERYRPWGNRAMLVAGSGQEVDRVSVEDVIQVLEKVYFRHPATAGKS